MTQLVSFLSTFPTSHTSPIKSDGSALGQKWGLTPLVRPLLLSGICLSSLLSIACGDPLKFPQDLEETRVLGLKVSTNDDLSWPKEGEEAEVEMLIAGPDGPVAVQVGYQVCAALESSWGVPQCSDPVLAKGSTSKSRLPRFPFTGVELPEGQRLAIVGVACESGEPRAEGTPQDFSCDDDSHPLLFSFESSQEFSENPHPVLDDLVVTLDNEELPHVEVEAELDCASALSVAADETMVVHLDLDQVSRDADELLQLSHLSTRGRFERQYSIVRDDAQKHIDLEFETPEESGVFRSYLVLRDGRGGTDWIAWDLCVED